MIFLSSLRARRQFPGISTQSLMRMFLYQCISYVRDERLCEGIGIKNLHGVEGGEVVVEDGALEVDGAVVGVGPVVADVDGRH